MIKPLSLAAAHCMGEVKLSSETKETEHPYKNDVHKEVRKKSLYVSIFDNVDRVLWKLNQEPQDPIPVTALLVRKDQRFGYLK